MNIHYQWEDEAKTILRVIMGGRFSWDEAAEATHHVRLELSATPHRVAVIADYSRNVFISPNYSENMRRLLYPPPPNIELLVTMGNPLKWELFRMFLRMNGDLGIPNAYADTLEEAFVIVKKFRAGKPLSLHQPPLDNVN